jgi:hypothetical protein
MVQVHMVLAAATVAGAVLLALTATIAEVRRDSRTVRLAIAFRRLALLGVVPAAVSGLFLMAFGHRPTAGLHLLYGAVAVAVLPVTTEVARRRPSGSAGYHAIGAVLMLAIVYRLYATG